jgi:WhiB family redox-sensing transcriptional regulator
MPYKTATFAAGDDLPAALLAEAAADTKRSWRARGHCAETDPELFFPPRDGPADEARAICGSCAVRRQCLAYAITADEPYGIWGGLDPGERRNLRRRLQRASGGAENSVRGQQ